MGLFYQRKIINVVYLQDQESLSKERWFFLEDIANKLYVVVNFVLMSLKFFVYIFNLNLGAISWSLKKQLSIALSSSTIIHCDNQSTISIRKNFVFHGRAKHRDMSSFYSIVGI